MRTRRCAWWVMPLFFLTVIASAFGAEGLVAWWPFDGDLKDKAGSVELSAAGETAYGEGGIVLDGKGQFLSAKSSKRLNMGTSDFSIEATIKLKSYPRNNGFIFANGGVGAAEPFYYLSMENKGNVIARIGDGKNKVEALARGVELSLGKWYHVVAAFNRKNKTRVYINGKLAALSLPVTHVGSVDGAGGIKVGMLWTQFFCGTIDDIRIYRGVLSEDDIERRFQDTTKRRKNDIFPRIIPLQEMSEFEWRVLSAAETSQAKGIRKGNMLGDSSFEGLQGVAYNGYSDRWVRARVQSKEAWHGDCSADASWLCTAYYNFRPDIPLTFSFYAKGEENPAVKVRIRHGCDKIKRGAEVIIGGHVEKEFALSKDWERYSYSFMPGALLKVKLQTLRIEIKGSSKAFVDAMQLEEGPLTPYSPGKEDLHVYIPRSRKMSDTTLFFTDQEIPVHCTVVVERPGTVAAALVVRDLWKQERYRRAVEFDIPEGKVVARKKLSVPPLPRGAYQVSLETRGAKSRGIAFGVIGKELSEGSEILGGGHMTGIEDHPVIYNRGLTEALGVTWSRHNAAKWEPAIQPDGSFAWPEQDKLIADKSRSKKLRFWGSFTRSPAPWREEDVYLGNLKKGHNRDAELKPLTEEYLSGMENFMRKAVEHFKDKVKYWECGNETPTNFRPKQYLRLLKRFYKVVKETDPDAIVVAPSGFFRPDFWHEFMAPFMKMGGCRYLDAFSFHGYFKQWPENVLHVGEFASTRDFDTYGERHALSYYLDSIRAEMKKVGKVKPIWDDEFIMWGSSWYDEDRARPYLPNDVFGKHIYRYINYREAVSMIAHYVIIGYAHGIRHFGPHMLNYYHPEQEQRHLGYDPRATDYDRSIKPKVLSYAVACNKMNQAVLVKERIEGDLFVYVFAKPTGSMAAVFTREAKPASVTIPGTHDLSIKDVFGADFRAIKRVGNNLVLDLPGEPIYIESAVKGDQLARQLDNLRMMRP